jgi:hypothetical protein
MISALKDMLALRILFSQNYSRETPIHEIQQSIKDNLELAIAALTSIRESFQNDIQNLELDNPSARILKACNGLELHPAIAETANNLYKDGHYANAVGGMRARNYLI